MNLVTGGKYGEICKTLVGYSPHALWVIAHIKSKNFINLVGHDPQERGFFEGYLVGYNPQYYKYIPYALEKRAKKE